MDGTVLVADDDRTIRTVLTQALTRAGVRVHATSSLTTLMRWVAEGKGDAIITDVMMPDGNGLEMLPKIHHDRPGLPVIVISAQNNIMTAIQANEANAFDYLPKPFDLPDLMKRVRTALESRRQARKTPAQVGTGDVKENSLPLIGSSQVMQKLYQSVAQIMNSDLPILISGESGVGKSLLARVLHDYSDRRNLPFVTMTQLDFETVDGPAKAIARAKGGSILIEEISDLTKEAQGRFVRMIDTFTEPTPRFIGTLQADAAGFVENETIRKDLYYRLGGVTLDVPTLRDRIEDLPELIEHFQAQITKKNAVSKEFVEDVIHLFRRYSWPGNVRQLQNVITRLILTARKDMVSLDEAEYALRDQPEMSQVFMSQKGDKLGQDVDRHVRRYFRMHGDSLPPSGLYDRILREIEIPLIEISLEATGGNQAKCADLLGINRNTLRKKINELDIKVTRGRKLM